MKYHIETLGFEKLIKKLKKHPLKKQIIAEIDALQKNPFLGKYLKNKNLYELKYPNLRIYYYVIEGVIIIFEEEFDGIILIDGFSNKNQQKRYLQ
jgi:hypothetical protein